MLNLHTTYLSPKLNFSLQWFTISNTSWKSGKTLNLLTRREIRRLTSLYFVPKHKFNISFQCVQHHWQQASDIKKITRITFHNGYQWKSYLYWQWLWGSSVTWATYKNSDWLIENIKTFKRISRFWWTTVLEWWTCKFFQCLWRSTL